MKTPDEILLQHGFDVNRAKKYASSTYNNVRKAMDEFAEQYAEWKIQKISERQLPTEVSEQQDSKVLHIADVSGCLLEFMLWYKKNVPIGTQKSSKDIVSDFLNNR